MNLIKWIICTKAQYVALTEKDQYGLYFISDTKEIFRGATPFTEAVVFVDVFPTAANAALGKIYINNATMEGKVLKGDQLVRVIQPVVNELIEGEDQDGVTSATAVKNYVDSRIGASGAVDAIAFDEATKSITYSKNGVPQDAIELVGMAHDLTYDAGKAQLVFKRAGKADQTIQLEKENFLQDVTYNPETKEIEFVLVNGSTFTINVSDLVDIYLAGADTKTASVSIDKDNKITVDVKVSAATNNAITVKADGLHVDVTGKADRVAADRADEVLVADATGNLKLSGKKHGGATISATPNVNTLASEAAVDAIRAALQGDIDTKADNAAIQAALATKFNKADVVSVVGAEGVNNKVASEKAVRDAIKVVDAEVAKKANQADVDAAIALKADKTQVAADLATKADKTQVAADLATKVAKADIATTVGGIGVNTKVASEKAVRDAINAAMSWEVLV